MKLWKLKMRLWASVLATLAVFALVEGFPMDSTDAETEVIVLPNTPENIERLSHLSESDLAEELSGQYQGDIIISAEQLREYESRRSSRTGLRDERYRWLNGVVPYRVNESDFNEDQIEYIHVGAKKMEEVTCLKFVPYDPSIHEDFITVMGSGSGCYSSVGRRGREQFLNLQPNVRESGCFRLYTIVHEFIHAIGFYHMQSAPERDDYVRIEFDLLQAGTAHNFNKYGFETVSNFDVEYDYGSVMHYSKTAFSISGEDTIIPIRDLNGETMGQRLRLSDKDIERVNRMYCSEGIETTTEETHTSRRPPIIPQIPQFTKAVHAWARNLLGNILGNIRHSNVE